MKKEVNFTSIDALKFDEIVKKAIDYQQKSYYIFFEQRKEIHYANSHIKRGDGEIGHLS